MKPIYRFILVALLIAVSLFGSCTFGYNWAERTRSEAESPKVLKLKSRIRELEAREKSRTSSGENTDKPPTGR